MSTRDKLKKALEAIHPGDHEKAALQVKDVLEAYADFMKETSPGAFWIIDVLHDAADEVVDIPDELS